MADTITIEKLRGLILSASELREMTDWPEALIEDYLAILDNIILLAEFINIEIIQKIETVPTDFSDGSIPVTSGGFLTQDNANFSWSLINKILAIGGIITSEGRRKQIKRVTTTPYFIQREDENIFVDTDAFEITLILPTIITGEQHKITNVGSSGNKAIIQPSGFDLLNGFNANEDLFDSESFDLGADNTEGWWL